MTITIKVVDRRKEDMIQAVDSWVTILKECEKSESRGGTSSTAPKPEGFYSES